MVTECAQCGAVLEYGQNTCASCGGAVDNTDVAIHDEETHRLLAEANLMRIRKQRDEAVSLCTRVLRLDPANAVAHSLMGDIHRDEGNFREALGWYKLAVQLDGSSHANRKKLDEMIDHVFQGAAQGEQADASMFGSGAGGRSERDHSFLASIRDMLGKITPTHVVIGSVVLGLAVMAFILLKGPAKPTNPVAPPNGTPQFVTPVNGNPDIPVNGVLPQAPQIYPSPADTVEGGGTKIHGLPIAVVTEDNDTVANAPADPNTDTTTTPPLEPSDANNGRQVPPLAPQPISTPEMQRQTELLRNALKAELQDSELNATLDAVDLDPRTGKLTISYTIEDKLDNMKRGLLYSGFKLIWAAENTTLPVKLYILRGSARVNEDTQPLLALLADVSPKQASDAREASTYSEVAKYLSNVWWRDDLKSVPL